MRKTIAGIALAAGVATVLACGGGSSPHPCLMFGAWGEMPDLDMLAGDTVETSLLDHFAPRECFNEDLQAAYGDFAARSADPAAVAVSVSEYVLTTIAIAAMDSVLVNVGLELWIDSGGCIRQPGSRCYSDPDHNHNFLVSVKGPPPR